MTGKSLWVVCAVLVLSACDSRSPVPSAPPADVATAPAAITVARNADPQMLARGGALYRQHCATCHGARAEGAPNWQRPGPDGKYPAPPLDGSGHAWHHTSAALEQTIRGGTIKLGGVMPAWGEKLSDAEIKAIVAWFQSLWPEEIYSAWLKMESRTKK